MSVLAKIRNRSGLLVAVVGGALVIFILQAALESGNSFFGNSQNDIGEIAGKSISFQEFNAKVQENIEAQTRNSGRSLEDFQRDMIIQQTWNSYINEMVMDKEYEKLGITVSADELTDLMVEHPHENVIRQISDPQTGKVAPAFADPATGQLSVAKLKEFTQQMNPEQEATWVKLEEYIQKVRIAEKYNNLIKKGIYVTTSQAKMEHIAQNRQFNIRYVVKKFASVADSTLKVEESDIRNYYNNHLNEFKEEEEKRKIEYVAFDVNPTPEDIKEIENGLVKIAEELKGKTAKEDSTFVMAESDTRFFDNSWHKKGSLAASIDSLLFASEKGTVLGPMTENSVIKVVKLVDTRSMPDSVKARHILVKIENGDTKKAQAKVDSIKKILTTKNFADIAKQISEDKGSGEKGGDLGWFKEGAMVAPFQEACFTGKKGEITTAISQFGIHIIEIQDKGVESPRVKIATIEKKIVPSTKTEQAIYAKANEFAGKLTSSDLFDKIIIDEKLSKREADNLKENDRNIPGIENSKEIIRWAYNAEKGDLFQPQQFGNKFIVARLTEIREKGVQPLEIVKNQATIKAIQFKKAEQFANELSGGTSIDELAKKINATAERMDNLNFNSGFIPGAGKEEAVVGATVTLKPNALSKPITGNNGVYVVVVESIKEAEETKDYTGVKSNTLSQLQYRTDSEVFEALKNAANVVDHKAKFF